MKRERITVQGIPALVWGEQSDKVYLYVHGKMSSKEAAEDFAQIAGRLGWQTVSFDLPEHGDRKGSPERCDIHTGIRELNVMSDYVFCRWKKVSLYGCSLGACFSLYALAERAFHNCLFQSPIVDMGYLISNMLLWFGISEDRLRQEKEISTPVDVMRWEDYRFYRTHDVPEWKTPTAILYGGQDNLQSMEVVRSFAERNFCSLTVSETSQHPFLEPEDMPIVENWLRRHIGISQMHLRLVKLTPEYRQHLTDMMGEWLAAEQGFSPYAIRKNDYRNFEYYLEHLEVPEGTPGKVPDSVFFCLDTERNRFVGAVNIRHSLNAALLHTGGHIGDGVRPTERRKGIATAMIRLALEECRKLGIERVLMTCDTDNTASACSIRSNGGMLENEIINEDGVPEQRYWIELRKQQ